MLAWGPRRVVLPSPWRPGSAPGIMSTRNSQRPDGIPQARALTGPITGALCRSFAIAEVSAVRRAPSPTVRYVRVPCRCRASSSPVAARRGRFIRARAFRPRLSARVSPASRDNGPAACLAGVCLSSLQCLSCVCPFLPSPCLSSTPPAPIRYFPDAVTNPRLTIRLLTPGDCEESWNDPCLCSPTVCLPCLSTARPLAVPCLCAVCWPTWQGGGGAPCMLHAFVLRTPRRDLVGASSASLAACISARHVLAVLPRPILRYPADDSRDSLLLEQRASIHGRVPPLRPDWSVRVHRARPLTGTEAAGLERDGP